MILSFARTACDKSASTACEKAVIAASPGLEQAASTACENTACDNVGGPRVTAIGACENGISGRCGDISATTLGDLESLSRGRTYSERGDRRTDRGNERGITAVHRSIHCGNTSLVLTATRTRMAAILQLSGEVGLYYRRWMGLEIPLYTVDTYDNLPDIASVKRKLKKIPEEFYLLTGLPMVTPKHFDLWVSQVLCGKKVLLHEIMSGSGRLSLACCLQGFCVAFPVDFRYGWSLRRHEHQEKPTTVTSFIDFYAPACGPWGLSQRSAPRGHKDKVQVARIVHLEMDLLTNTPAALSAQYRFSA